MAGELQVRHTTGKNVYAQIRSAVGTIWNGTAFEAYQTVNIATYAFGMIEQGGNDSQVYIANFPAAIEAGAFTAWYWEQVGGGPAESDLYISTEVVEWNGSALIPRAAWALVDAEIVSPARTWTARTDKALCREIVEVTTSDTAVYSMFFGAPGVLNPGTSLLTADSVTDTSGNSLPVSEVTLSQDKMSMHFTVTSTDLTADTTYTMKATTTATDGVQFAKVGTLRSI